MTANYSIQALPLDERPRERLLRYGAEAISSAELVAIVLGSGMRGKSVLQLSQELVSHFGSVQAIGQATVEELQEIKGMGEAKAIQIKAAIGLGIKAAATAVPPRYRIGNPTHAYHLVKEELEAANKELFVVILQDAKGCLIRYEVVSIGTLSDVQVHPREVFHPAIRHKAASVVVAHNHPSGDLEPSQDDLTLTKQLVAAGSLLEIPVRDHLIVGKGRYLSLRQHGASFA